MSEDNYFFVDGSCLLKDISALKSGKSRAVFASKKLDIVKFAELFTEINLRFLTNSFYKRFVVYFVEQENRIADNIILPPFEQPGVVMDLQIKMCGKRIRGGDSVDKWILKHKPPKKVLEKLNKSEKAVDTQICCDAFLHAHSGGLDRLFLYTNDYDFIPLCRTLKSVGANVSLFRLQKERINKDLVKECDSFSVVPDNQLVNLFVP